MQNFSFNFFLFFFLVRAEGSSVTRWLDYLFPYKTVHLTQKHNKFAKIGWTFCQILDKPLRNSQGLFKNSKVAKFRQSWSHWQSGGQKWGSISKEIGCRFLAWNFSFFVLLLTNLSLGKVSSSEGRDVVQSVMWSLPNTYSRQFVNFFAPLQCDPVSKLKVAQMFPKVAQKVPTVVFT